MSVARPREAWLLSILALLSFALQLPFLARGLSRLDEGSILAIADALNRGEVLYRDRATFIGPLIYEGMAALAALFGESVMVGRVVQALIFTACTLVGYRVLREFTGLRFAVGGALAFMAVKPLAFPLWTIPNYSQWATLLALVALYAGLRFLDGRSLRWLLLAGLAVGVAGVTKQTGAGIIGVSLATTVVVDALLAAGQRPSARVKAIALRGGVLLLAALPPLLFFGAYYTSQAALGDAVDRAVLGLQSYSSALGVPLPDLRVWSSDPALLATRSFVYFPTPVLALAWQGGLNLYSTPVALAVEHAVKAVYYGPLLAAAFACLSLRGLARAETRRESLGMLFVLLLAGLSYWSASFRADWTHLMSVAPEVILLCTLVLHRFSRGRPWLSAIGAGLCAAWLVAGALAAAAALAAYATPLETARGELLVTPDEALATRAVLDFEASQSAESRIAFLPTQPVFYALSGRPIVSPFDLLIPAYFRDGDDALLARALEAADQIVYDPNAMPTIAASLSDFAPESAALLARSFGFERALAPTAYLFRRLATPPRELVVDLSALPFEDASMPDRIEREDWMMYRVLAASLRKRDTGTCFSLQHAIGKGELLSFVPMLPPLQWSGAPAFGMAAPQMRRGRFAVLLQEGSGPMQKLFSELRQAGDPVRPVEVGLDVFAGRTVTLSFCATRVPSDPATPGVLGWGEVQVLRRPGVAGS